MSFPLLASSPQYNEWAVLGLLFLIAAAFALFNVLFSSALGPKRTGPAKNAPYESGVLPAGDTKKRFNVRFYLIAIIFLVFEVEILFLIPWLTIFPKNAFDSLHLADPPYHIHYGILFAAMLTFTAILLVAYLYAWGKGVLKWD